MEKKVKKTRPKEDSRNPEIKTLRLRELKPCGYNPRTMNEEAMSSLQESLRQFGCVEPIVVNRFGRQYRIVGGHQRVKALLANGTVDAPCVIVSLDPEKEKLLNIALNNPLLQGQFNQTLIDLIESLKKTDQEDLIDSLRIEQLRSDIEKEFAASQKKKRPKLPESMFSVIVDCTDEKQQQEVYELLSEEGYSCRLLTL